jgi:adenylate kinase family enzyme
MSQEFSQPDIEPSASSATERGVNQRIAIVGTSGSGKTTLAQQVSQILEIPHIELDALFWQPNWKMSNSIEFFDRIEAATVGDRWVVDGNYLRARWLLWHRVTTVVWLNYTLPLVLWRVTRRTIRRSWHQEELWNGCRETWRKSFLSQDSIILWVCKTYYRYQREFPDYFAMPQYQHIQVVELRSPSETDEWLASLANVSTGEK